MQFFTVKLIIIILVAAIVSVKGGYQNELAQFQNNLKNLKLKVFFNNTKGTPDISNNYLNLICDRDVSTTDISEPCAAQMEAVCNHQETMELMADAWSKIPYAGMITASRQDWGAFDQCLKVEYEPENGPRVLGKQCTMGLAIPVDLSFEDFYLLSYCVPDACSALDVARLITVAPIPEEIVTEMVNELACATKETNSSMGASSITIAALFCFFLALVVISTSYEVFLHKRHIKNRRPILTAFSIFTNGKKIAQTSDGKENGEQILVFHGIKVISMMWILAGHAAALFSVIPVTNRERQEGFEAERYAQYLATAYLAVDTFFFISGFLLAYQYFKGPANKPLIVQVMSIPKMIIHRYLRITPVVLMFFLYGTYLTNYIGSGPIYNAVHEELAGPCKKYWWSVFLYVQNYVNPTEMCWVHLWYLSADWQLFLLSPLILIPMAWQFKKRFNTVLLALVILNVFFLLLSLFVKLIFPEFDPEYLEYDTHSKLTTYFMGVMFGFCMRCKKDKSYIFRKGLNILMWFFSLLTLFTATVLLHDANMFRDSHITISLIHVFVKPFWCLGLMFVIYSCTRGYGGIVNWFLTAGWMQVISKLTFCMYIMHVPVIVFWTGTRRTRNHFHDLNLFFYWCGHFITTLIISLIWTLTFESPLITIEKVLMGGGKPRAAKHDEPADKITIVHKPPTENGYV